MIKECIVNLPQGALRGTVHGSYRQFFDVPYAEDQGRFAQAGVVVVNVSLQPRSAGKSVSARPLGCKSVR